MARYAVGASLWIVIPVLISSVWLLPLVVWYSYSVGEPLTAPRLLGILGPLNLIWLAFGRLSHNSRPVRLSSRSCIPMRSSTRKAAATHELAVSRALTNQLAMDGRHVLWCVFREHAVTAPLAIAASNLFSTTQEHFGVDGVALQRSVSGGIDTEEALRLARHLGVEYYLVKTEGQVKRLIESASVRPLWAIDGWTLFTNQAPASPAFETVKSVPVLAWMPARFKSRYAHIPDLFNLSEQLVFDSHPDITVLWVLSQGAEAWQLVSLLPETIVVIHPESLALSGDWLPTLSANASKLKLLLLDDGTPLAAEVDRAQDSFASYRRSELRTINPPPPSSPKSPDSSLAFRRNLISLTPRSSGGRVRLISRRGELLNTTPCGSRGREAWRPLTPPHHR